MDNLPPVNIVNVTPEDTQPENLVEYSLDSLLQAREKYDALKEEAEQGIATINEELLFRLNQENIKGKVVGDKTITKCQRVNFEVSIDQARDLGCVKEAIDTSKLKKLYDKGVELKTRIVEYVLIKTIKKEAHE